MSFAPVPKGAEVGEQVHMGVQRIANELGSAQRELKELIAEKPAITGKLALIAVEAAQRTVSRIEHEQMPRSRTDGTEETSDRH